VSAKRPHGTSWYVARLRLEHLGNWTDDQHLNSIQKDSAGNYLISTRHYSTIFYLSPAGEILWELGGRNSSFQMGEGTEFFWQHDARWIDEGTRLRYVYNTRGGQDSKY